MPKKKSTIRRKTAIEDYTSLVEALAARQGTLSKRLQQVAQFFLNNPEDVAINNIVKLAKLAEVPAPTITRFAKELGFSGFSELQNVFQQRLVGPRMAYADRLKALAGHQDLARTHGLDLEQPSVVFDTFVQAAQDTRLVTGHHRQDWLLYDTDWNWRLEPEQGGHLRAIGHVEGFADTFHALFGEVYQAIAAGGAPKVLVYATFEDGHYEMIIGDAVARSAREGCWVDVG